MLGHRSIGLQSIQSVYKAFLFSLLVIGFHYFEEGTKRFLQGKATAGTFYEMGFDLLIARSLVVFSTFVPFCAFSELRRVLGEGKFDTLFFISGRATKSDLLADLKAADHAPDLKPTFPNS